MRAPNRTTPRRLVLGFLTLSWAVLPYACGGQVNFGIGPGSGTGSGTGSGVGTGSGSGTGTGIGTGTGSGSGTNVVPGNCAGPAPLCPTCQGEGPSVCVGGSWQCPPAGPCAVDASFPPMDAGGSCSSAPPTNVRSVTIVASGIDFGDKTQTDWETIGFNLDAQCTTAASTGVCTLSAGAPKSVQVDGVGGIDNSFGANICPLIDTVSGAGACSSPAELVYVVTDAAGNGLLSMAFNGQALQFPITDAFVAMNGNGGGTLAAVAPTAGFIAALRVAAGHLSVSLCSGAAFQSIATQIQQDADILTNGSNVAGQACDGISLGMTFASSTPLTQPLPPVTDPCGD